MIALLSLILLMTIVLLVYQYWKTAKLQQELFLLKESQAISLLEASLKSREEERQRFARDWHDNMGNILSTARLLVDAVPTTNKLLLQSIQQLLENAHLVAKNIFTDARINLLDSRQALLVYLEQLEKRLALVGIQCFFTIDKALPFHQLKREQQWHFSNILQELITNILKHANASVIEISLTQSLKGFCLQVIDNGKGMELNNTPIPKTVEERVALLNADLTIESNTPSGTKVVIYF